MTALEIVESIVILIEGIFSLAARTGVDIADLETSKARILDEIDGIDCAEIAQIAKEWRIARGEIP